MAEPTIQLALDFENAKTRKRFFEKVDRYGPVPEKNPEIGNCYIWKASKTGEHPVFYLNEEMGVITAARAIWILEHGWIDSSVRLKRKCGNIDCVRPSHLCIPDDAERFWSYVDRNGPVPKARPDLGNCWIWNGHRIKGGYGQVTIRGKGQMAHRVSYEWENGEIPEQLTIDHMCLVTSCVRPSHMAIATQRENILRGNALSAINARKTHCDRGHEFTPDNIYVRKLKSGRDGRICKICHSTRTRRYKGRLKEAVNAG